MVDHRNDIYEKCINFIPMPQRQYEYEYEYYSKHVDQT